MQVEYKSICTVKRIIFNDCFNLCLSDKRRMQLFFRKCKAVICYLGINKSFFLNNLFDLALLRLINSFIKSIKKYFEEKCTVKRFSHKTLNCLLIMIAFAPRLTYQQEIICFILDNFRYSPTNSRNTSCSSTFYALYYLFIFK